LGFAPGRGKHESRIQKIASKTTGTSFGTVRRGEELSTPTEGWLRAIREATGISLRETTTRLKKTPTLAAKLEKSEGECRITLASLRDAADALGCHLVYALEEGARTKAAENVRAVEHSMVLEDQAVGGIEDKIGEEPDAY